MKIKRIQQRTNQYLNAVKELNELRESYDPSNFYCLGKIATNVVMISEFVTTKEFNANVPGGQKQQYFEGTYKKDYCLILSKEDKFQGYSRNKVMKYLRGESPVHGKLNDADDDKDYLQSYLYEEDSKINVDFAIRRDFIDTPFIKALGYNDTDSQSYFSEPTNRTINGIEHELTTIESVVFSICNEIGSIGYQLTMGWDKAIITHDDWYKNMLDYFPDHISANLEEQSTNWNDWNKFPIK